MHYCTLSITIKFNPRRALPSLLIVRFFARFPPFWQKTGALTLTLSHQVFSANQQGAECGHQAQSTGVFGQSPITTCAVTEDLCNVSERMLIPLLNPRIIVIIEESLLVTVKQVSGEYDFVDVGRHGVDSVDQPKSVISAELPLPPLLGLMHFRISLALYIFGGAGRRNGDDGVYNAAFAQDQAIFLRVLAHFFEKHRAEVVMRQEMAELEDCDVVRQTIQLQSGELAHGFNLVHCIFHSRVAVALEQLHALNPEYGGKRIGCSTNLVLGIITGCLLLQLLLANHFLQSFQKRFAASFAILGLVLGLGEGDLIHRALDPMRLTVPILMLILILIQSLLIFAYLRLKQIKAKINYFSQNKNNLIQPIIPDEIIEYSHFKKLKIKPFLHN